MPGGWEWIIIIFTLGILLIPGILYLITLQNTLKVISAENRQMPPENVWLMLIPFFNLIWHFIIVNKIADSIRAEANKQNLQLAEDRPGYSIGIAMCILSCVNLIPIINMLSGIGSLICWIIYWSKISSYKNQLKLPSYYNNR